MLAVGIKTPTPLDELEIHLREEIEQQVKTGINETDAFNSSVKKIGRASALKLEFKKVFVSMETRFVKLAGMACGLTAGFFSLWILYNLLFLHQVSNASRILGFMAVASTILSWRYGRALLPAIGNRHAGKVIAAACCLTGVSVVLLFIKIIPHFFDVPAGSEIPASQLLVLFLWAWTAMAVLGAIAYGIEDAAHKNKAHYV